MKKSKTFKDLLDLILTFDLHHATFDMLLSQMQPYLRKLAKSLYVAKSELHFETESEIYNIIDKKRILDTVYLDSYSGNSEPVQINYRGNANTYGLYYPYPDHIWTDDEIRNIGAVSNLIFMIFAKLAYVKHQDKVPYIDFMTGLLNHQGLRHYGEQFERMYTFGDYVACNVHIHNFKYIEHHFSHTVADEVIRRYSKILYQNADCNNELLARLGPARFFVLIHKDKLDSFLDFISTKQANVIFEDNNLSILIRAKIGVYPAHEGDGINDLITKSSFALEQAKADKITISYFDKEKLDFSKCKKAVIEALPQAIENIEIVPYYQPKVDIDGNSLCGCEALARWIHDGKMIPPIDFIPIAENSGLITSLDLYMLRLVCNDIRNWIDIGIEPVCVSINYSQQNFNSKTIIDDTLNIINEYKIDGKYLEFEITETSYIQNFDILKEFIDQMHKRQIKVSIDDFGVGYSSLKMFGSLDIDTVKLDKSLFEISDPDDKKAHVILRSITSMINEIDTTTVAEGIENDWQLDLVHEMGGHIVQGYIFDKPLNHNEFTKRLQQKSYNK